MRFQRTIAGLCIGGTLLAGAAEVTAATLKTRDGYYADIVKYKSAEVTFHVRKHGTFVGDLAVLCTPKNPALIAGSGDAGIAVDAPHLQIRDGQINYQGPAAVQPFSAGEKKTGESTLKVHLHRVAGPVFHYTYEGNHLSETAAWKGTVYSPACTSMGNGGKATLFGPTSD